VESVSTNYQSVEERRRRRRRRCKGGRRGGGGGEEGRSIGLRPKGHPSHPITEF